MRDLKRIKGDASFRKFFRKKNKLKNSVIVYAKKEKFKNLLIYDAINKILIKNKVLAPKLLSEKYNNNYIEIQDFGNQRIFDVLRKSNNKFLYFKKIIKILNQIQRIRDKNIKNFKDQKYTIPKYSKKMLLSGLYFFRAISIGLFIFLPPSQISALAFGVTFGLLWLSTVPPTNGLVGHIFGTKHLGLLYGIVFVSHQIGSFLGAYLGGLFHDLYGSLDYAWYISIALSLFAGLIHLPIKEKAIERPQLA